MFSAIEAALDLDGARVLDLYAGSGALGLEALSRGASAVTFVESDRGALTVLRSNISHLALPGASAVSGRVLSFLAGAPSPYDLILADPPYADTDIDSVVAALSGWVAPDGLVIIERSVRSPAPAWPAFLTPLRVKKYGDTALHWAEHHAAEA
jgi:16S rRNA (guanine966-N2)-methyltransferase